MLASCRHSRHPLRWLYPSPPCSPRRHLLASRSPPVFLFAHARMTGPLELAATANPPDAASRAATDIAIAGDGASDDNLRAWGPLLPFGNCPEPTVGSVPGVVQAHGDAGALTATGVHLSSDSLSAIASIRWPSPRMSSVPTAQDPPARGSIT